MMTKKFKRIGILGGMGPETSANFFSKILKYCQEKYKAIQDIDYPPIVLYSLPLYGFDESGIVDEELVLNQLISGIKILEMSNCDFVVIPCNTVHCFIDKLREVSSINIISIIEETVKLVKKDNKNIVGLLASETTLDLKLYQTILSRNNVLCLLPNKKEREIITNLILQIMSGKVDKDTKLKNLSIIEKMKKQSAESIILGCTELPLAIAQEDSDLKIYDTLQILVESAVEYSIKDPILKTAVSIGSIV